MWGFPMFIKPLAQRRTFKAVLAAAGTQGRQQSSAPSSPNFAVQWFAVISFIRDQPWCSEALLSNITDQLRSNSQFMHPRRSNLAGQNHSIGAGDRVPAIAAKLMKTPARLRIGAQSSHRQGSRIDQAVPGLRFQSPLQKSCHLAEEPRKIGSLSAATKSRLVRNMRRPGKTHERPQPSFTRRFQLTHDSTQRAITKRRPQPTQRHIIDRISIGSTTTRLLSPKPTCRLSNESIYFLPQQLAVHGISFPKFKGRKDLYHEAGCCYLAI